MRVIAGRYRSRQLKSLKGKGTRPMLDRLRETLFNVLRGQIEGKVFADLYAGTGAIGIEALSRGASRAIFVESNPAAASLIRENLHSLGAEQDAQIVCTAVQAALSGISADIFFLGPPYELVDEYQTTLSRLGEAPPRLVIAQHAKLHLLAEAYGRLQRVRTVAQGDHCLSFYRE